MKSLIKGAIIVFSSVTFLSACQKEPRSASYFLAHREEAQQVLAGCKEGKIRGEECVNALAVPQDDLKKRLFAPPKETPHKSYTGEIK